MTLLLALGVVAVPLVLVIWGLCYLAHRADERARKAWEEWVVK